MQVKPYTYLIGWVDQNRWYTVSVAASKAMWAKRKQGVIDG